MATGLHDVFKEDEGGAIARPRKGDRMMPDPVVLFATVILLVPIGYFLLAAPAFLLVKLDIPPVTLLLRGMFNAYFLVLAVAAFIGTVAFAAEGGQVFAAAIGSSGFRSVGAPIVSATDKCRAQCQGSATPIQSAGFLGCVGAACCPMRPD